jgi:hypothetical protein
MEALLDALHSPNEAFQNLHRSRLAPLPHIAAVAAAEDDGDVVLRHLPAAAQEAIVTRPVEGEDYAEQTGEASRWPLDAWERAVAAIQIVFVDRGCPFPWSQWRFILQDVAVFCSSMEWPVSMPEPSDVATWLQLRAALARNSDESTTR